MNDIWQVYIIKCKDGELYTGIAKDVDKRVALHNKGLSCRYTQYRGPVKLLYCESYKNRKDAAKREAKIKGLTRRKKLEIINAR